MPVPFWNCKASPQKRQLTVIVLERRSLFFTTSDRGSLLLIRWAIIQFPSKSDLYKTLNMSKQSELTMNDSINNMLVVSSVSNVNPIKSYDPEALRNSFHSEIRPILDVLDKLRTQGITEENVNIPTIVVVGDQSSGKSSVLESLAGITLPRGQGIATRVPLILRLQSCLSEQDSKILMEYGSVKEMRINSEDDIEAAINAATDDLAGSNKNIRDTPILLHIRKPDAPDLTMVDLPGITRVPVHGQPENIYEQVRDMIMHYIKPEESIILNVLPAEVDFSTCESIRLSQTVDKKGVRTLAVVTKVDKAPEGLFEKVTSDAVSIGLGYVCVRNRTPADDSIAVARCRELELFNDHPDLRNIDRSMVGIPTLGRRLVKIQSDMVRGCLPRIRDQIHEALQKRRQEMSNVPRSIDSVNEAVAVFLRLQNEMLNMLTQVVRDGDFSLVPDDCTLHYTARLHEEFTKFAEDLGKSGLRLSQPSQTDEIRQMFSEHQGVALPDFLPHTVLHQLVKKQIDSITQTCIFLVDRVFKYAAEVVLHVQSLIFEAYPHLRDRHHKLAIQVLNETKTTTVEFVERMLAKERTVIFTTNASYLDTIAKINSAVETARRSNQAYIELDVGRIREGLILNEAVPATGWYREAWEMKVRIAAYSKIMHERLADEIPLEIRNALQRTIVNRLQELTMMQAFSSPEELGTLMQQDSKIICRRVRLQQCIDTLEKSLMLVSGMIAA
uniref:Dynamin-related GTPase n=2 Tax=Physcomitrium patens TaxID=3218 RepID=A0A2K1KBW7_PHYPA|nr:hypothetical protein PHYPA_010453 [Physcomitrium patens]